MNVNVQLYNEDGSTWDAFVAAHRYSTNYHQYGWREVIEKSFGHRTYYLAAEECAGKISGILPLVHMKSLLFGSFMVSLPFFNYGGMLCDNEDNAEALLLESGRILKSSGADHAELRHLALQGKRLETKQHKVTMILDLERDEEAQWKAFDAKVRNQVRKAEKNGLRAVTGHAELLDGFYEVFSRNMRDLGTPVYGKSFFRNILEVFPDTTRIVMVRQGDTVVASGLLTWFRNTLEVPWASSVRDYLEMCPNNLLYWEAMRFGIQIGLRKLDFGRSTPNEGTYRFKKQWGAEPVQLYWQYIMGGGVAVPELNPSNPRYKAAIRVWQRLPLPITRILGPMIVKNIP